MTKGVRVPEIAGIVSDTGTGGVMWYYSPAEFAEIADAVLASGRKDIRCYTVQRLTKAKKKGIYRACQ